jgi:exosome complex component RRP46
VTLTSVFLAVTSDGSSTAIILENPDISQTQSAESVHVLAFTSQGDLLVAESEGNFDLKTWDEVHEVGKAICCDNLETSRQISEETSGGLATFVKSTLQEKIVGDLYWRD